MPPRGMFAPIAAPDRKLAILCGRVYLGGRTCPRPIHGVRPHQLRGRNQNHEAIHVGRVNPQNTWPAAVGGQLPDSDSPAEGADAEAGPLGGVGEGFELAAGLGSVRHTSPKVRSRLWRSHPGTKIMEWTSIAWRTRDWPLEIEPVAHATPRGRVSCEQSCGSAHLHRGQRQERETGAGLDPADRQRG